MGVESNSRLKAELLKIKKKTNKTTPYKAWGQFFHFYTVLVLFFY